MLDLQKIKDKYADELQSLSQIFSDFDVDSLAMQLVECDYDLELAIAHLSSAASKFSCKSPKSSSMVTEKNPRRAVSQKKETVPAYTPWTSPIEPRPSHDLTVGVKKEELAVPSQVSDSAPVVVFSFERSKANLILEACPVVFPMSKPAAEVANVMTSNFRVAE